MGQITFTASKAEMAIISEIAKRASKMAEEAGPARDVQDFAMDIEATHCNGCPLDLERLLAADDFNFAHDVFGIERHLDRDESSPRAGKLTGFFRPRYAVRKSNEAV